MAKARTWMGTEIECIITGIDRVLTGEKFKNLSVEDFRKDILPGIKKDLQKAVDRFEEAPSFLSAIQQG
jgi:hypothetical protein